MDMSKYLCTLCGFIYDPVENNNVPFDNLPDNYECPICGAGKDVFEQIK